MMNSIRRFLAFFLTLTILVSSTGVVLAVHTCFISSKKQISLFQNKSCCSSHSKNCHSKPASSLKAKCCELSISYHKLDVVSNTIKYQHLDSDTGLPLVLFSALTKPQHSFTKIYLNKAPPESRGGIEFLYSIGSLLI